MDPNLIDEILDAVLPPIEAAESQTAAVIQLLRERGLLNEDDFARFREQAENASEIKSRAMRLRLKRILTAASDDIEKLKKQVDDLAQKMAEQAANPEHRAQKEGPPTKEEAAKQERPHEESRDEKTEQPKKAKDEQPKEAPKKEEAPAAREDREPQEPQRKAS